MGELSRAPPATLTIMLVERLSTWTERVTDMSKGAPSATLTTTSPPRCSSSALKVKGVPGLLPMYRVSISVSPSNTPSGNPLKLLLVSINLSSLSRPTVTPTATGTATRLPRNGNGTNGYHDEAPEPQQSLFSWAEFMAEEPVKPKGRGGKTQAPSLSLFEWAVEQEREEELVGAGR